MIVSGLPVIELPLTSDQVERFADVLRTQKEGDKSAIFCVVTDSYEPLAGRGVVRLSRRVVKGRVGDLATELP